MNMKKGPADLVGGESQFGEQFVVVLAEQRCRGAVHTAGFCRDPKRHGGVSGGGVDGMSDHFEEVA